MSSLDQAVQTHIQNIQKRTGKNLEELSAVVKKSGLSKHAEIRAMLMRDQGLSYGDANALVHAVLLSDGTRQAENKSQAEVLAGIYSGAKAGMRPIHEALMMEITKLGEFESVPKKGYISLRRKKQFVMLGPVTKTRVELGLNIKDLPPAGRLIEQPRGSMCNYVVKITDASQVDAELATWIKFAYESGRLRKARPFPYIRPPGSLSDRRLR
jgi:Domain of unknown function (DUF5655)/Domain of unknown function (DUF4287)